MRQEPRVDSPIPADLVLAPSKTDGGRFPPVPSQTLVARIASSSDLLSGGAAWSYLSEALCATAFGPGLTWLLVRSRQRWGGGRHAWQALLAKVEELEVSLHDTEEVYAVQSSRAAESSARCEVPTAGDTTAQSEPPRDDSFRLELPAPRGGRTALPPAT